jgi:membrane protein involved in colicin uptake
MKNFMVFAMLSYALMVAPKAQAQCCGSGIGDRLERVGTVMIERGADIWVVRDTNRTNEQISRDNNRTNERINERNAQMAEEINRQQTSVWSQQTVSQERIALEEQRTRRAEISAQRQIENDRVAADLCRDTAYSCSASVGYGQARVNKVERPANGNGPMVR